MHRVISLFFALCLIVLVQSWTFVMVSDRDMVDTAEVVLEGQVISYGPSLQTAMPSTDYKVAVTRLLKGNTKVNKNEVTVTILGGLDHKTQDKRLHVSGAPQFAPGDQVLLFLVKHKGYWTIHHFSLGAFYQIPDEDGTFFAARSFAEAKFRNYELFSAWIGASVSKRDADLEANYFSNPAGQLLKMQSRYNLVTYANMNARWSVFDDGGSADYLINGEFSSIANGGFDQIDEAMAAWNNNPTTTINIRRVGNTTITTGLSSYDLLNTIVWNDPNDEIPGAWNCSAGGTLAIGGWWTEGSTVTTRGATYAEIVHGDVVVQDGIECWINGNTSPDKTLSVVLAHELGHTIGLNHSCGDAASGDCTGRPDQDAAVMRSYTAANRGPDPGIDDINAITVLYQTVNETASTNTTITPGQLYFGSTMYYLIITIPETTASSASLATKIANVLNTTSDRIYITAITTPGKYDGTTDVAFYIYEKIGQISSYDLGQAMWSDVVNSSSVLSQNGLNVYYLYLWFVPNSPGNKPATPDGATPGLEAGAGKSAEVTSEGSGTNYAIVGGAVGGGVAVLAIVGLIVFLIIRKKNSQNKLSANFGY